MNSERHKGFSLALRFQIESLQTREELSTNGPEKHTWTHDLIAPGNGLLRDKNCEEVGV